MSSEKIEVVAAASSDAQDQAHIQQDPIPPEAYYAVAWEVLMSAEGADFVCPLTNGVMRGMNCTQ